MYRNIFLHSILQNVEFVNVIYQIAKCTFHAIAQQADLYVFFKEDIYVCTFESVFAAG